MTDPIRAAASLSLRAKLVTVVLLFEALGLAFMVWDGRQLVIARSEAGFQSSLAQVRPLLNAALAPAMAAGDAQRLAAVMAEVGAARGLAYLVAKDTAGRVIASVGWKAGERLPELDSTLESALPTSGSPPSCR